MPDSTSPRTRYTAYSPKLATGCVSLCLCMLGTPCRTVPHLLKGHGDGLPVRRLQLVVVVQDVVHDHLHGTIRKVVVLLVQCFTKVGVTSWQSSHIAAQREEAGGGATARRGESKGNGYPQVIAGLCPGQDTPPSAGPVAGLCHLWGLPCGPAVGPAPMPP
jgi:hypothetical protein